MLAVTPLQAELVRVARGYSDAFGDWPTAAELSVAADVQLPLVWAALRSLARVGVVVWSKKVEIVAAPGGVVFFLGLDTERPFSAAMSRDLAPAAGVP